MKIVCISGKAGHGKDYTADLLKKELIENGNSVLTIHYADLLKFICKKYLGWDGNKDESGRTLLQHIGTDIVREADKNYWVNFVMSILSMFPNEWEYVLIPDCRFANEIDCYYENEWLYDKVYHVHVVRPGFKSELTEKQKTHPSETELSNYIPDFILINSGTDDYKNVVQQLADSLINGVITFGGINNDLL